MAGRTLADAGAPQRGQLPDEVATYVREQIMSGAVRPGDFLRLEPIAEALGVSNTPVREGLLTLTNEGFVRLLPRRGFVVDEFTRQDVQDLFWTQAQFAGELASRAAAAITAEELTALGALVTQHAEAVRAGRGNADLAALNHEFHRGVNLAARSRHLARMLSVTARYFPNSFYAEIPGQIHACEADHPRLLDALAARDAGLSRRIAAQHLEERGDRLVEMLEARGIWRPDPVHV